tara:strand:+ start:203 stop:1036 length:834 start_codon:yes stop_codon:yes gene_type:complete
LILEKEKKYRRIGFWTAILTQVVMLILFYFLIAWKEPFPPIPSYGIELSFGLDRTGQGEVAPATPQPQEEVEESASQEETAEAEETSEPATEEVVKEAEVPTEPITKTPSPDVVEKKVEEPKPKPEPVKTEEPAKEVKKEEQKPASTPTVSEKPSPSQGNTNEPGDEGKKEGKLDDRAIYGSQGGGANGASLQMAGWVWDQKPNPNDKSDETGKIVYKIKIDDEGYIIDIELQSSTVTPAIERLYRQSVERLSFSKTSEYKPAPTSTGTITFLIQTK